MSSTNRTHRSGNDYYVTPVSAIKTFLQVFLEHEEMQEPILDPCAGGDLTHKMSYPVALAANGFRCSTIDIRQDSLAERKQDYLITDCMMENNTIITNPPFNLAQPIIEKALRDVKTSGFVIMLLRLNYFGSKVRKPFWDKQLPVYAFVHHKRIGFTDDGKTDSIEYMHCVWQKDQSPAFTKLMVI